MRTADCVIGGFRYAAASKDRVGSLLLGLYDDAGCSTTLASAARFPRRAAVARRAPSSVRRRIRLHRRAPAEAPSRWSRGADRDRSYVALRPDLVLEVAFDQVTEPHPSRNDTLTLAHGQAGQPMHGRAIADCGSVLELLEPEPGSGRYADLEDLSVEAVPQ